ncbi:BREX-1 system phosphatase PglZ type A [Rhizobium ruizarguesonis]|uniref:BREX-1 system phosphatase PglZ type A n=1 Tax=Rhizobium ruizarguesonis TaxID=2081791 RepID=UPI00103CBDAF|nr:BREX-1 system phosphatase PglZ type A [Rhizobium ruizarguesonis]MBY5806099.1 BREX-1 system phosphatase PglZ type A [Rhizobium leguminosarum]TCB12108.1 BREX-1 system phosphatase PglZ type A [Rhizobium leguminosarum bv. viciae]MBY5846863.1 BREX-1 system phosphatase PglZ type A [Rhizobium leguminosarum]NEH87936.1 BREX-1 system phosphatase PglZ type A [Rhizobium ruizarguesonis]NEJ58075.1 BREX-1 system phosphatase PglZ type A [Rhizobium ruizarguesonis]
MSDRIAASLRRLFEEHRIVFWYDTDRELRAEYDALELSGVTKLDIANNEFGLKYRILRQEPDGRFLLFKDGPEPPMPENWLLDVQLATAVFKADQAAIWVAELGLPLQFENIVRAHIGFFSAKPRVEVLKKLLHTSDTQTQMRLKMLAICAGAEGGLDTVIEALLGDLAAGKEDGLRLIERCGLTEFFWTQVGQTYGYKPGEPDFEDFAISLFQSAYARVLGEDGALNAEALLVFRRWKNNRHWAEAFETLSARYQDLLAIPADLKKRDFRTFVTIDHFEEIDREIIRQIVKALSAQAVGAPEVLSWVRERRQSHWYSKYEDIYQAIGFATEFQQALAEAHLGMTSASEGVQRYVSTWYRLDQLYRKFVYHMQKSGQAQLLSDLYESVENRYNNSYVLAVNDAWQDQVARLSDWKIPGYASQADFYREQAAEYRRKDQKVAVIISDALRFEVAEECLRRIRALDRFDADLKPMISSLPSYTQLGMAALLPHNGLAMAEDGSGDILSGGENTRGLAAREKLLAAGRNGDTAKALKFEDVMNMRVDEGKALFRDNHIIYIYHNRIDAIGDKLQTEELLPEAAEDTIDDLTKLVRKLTSANFSNILITADHGFLYQHRALDESDFAVADPKGDEILFRNRRFVIGRGLAPNAGMKHFTAANLGLSGDLDVLIPNSVNRMRVKGAGSRFVHGGASLQEIVIPVIRVGKQREVDVGEVEVQILVSGRSLISSGQTAVTLYQVQPVSEKMRPREVLAGIYAINGTLISDEYTLVFDFSSDNPREREMPRKFLLSREADRFNNQDVILKLRERVGKTSRYQDYATHRFELRRGMTTDFDF